MEQRWCRPCLEIHKPQDALLNSQLRKQVNNDRLVVRSQWRGPCSIHDFILDGLSFRPELTIPQTPNEIPSFLEFYQYVTYFMRALCVMFYWQGLGRHIVTFFPFR